MFGIPLSAHTAHLHFLVKVEEAVMYQSTERLRRHLTHLKMRQPPKRGVTSSGEGDEITIFLSFKEK